MNWPDRGRKRGYWKNILVGFDQSGGTFFGIDADETISSWVGRNKRGSWQEELLNFVFGPNHCQQSIERHDESCQESN